MDVFFAVCLFVCAILASRAYPSHRRAWVAGQWLSLATAAALLTMR